MNIYHENRFQGSEVQRFKVEGLPFPHSTFDVGRSMFHVAVFTRSSIFIRGGDPVPGS
jgi:hypothetical protein